MSRFYIGTQAAGTAGMKDLCALIAEDPATTTYQEYSEVVGEDLDGAPIEAGLPRAAWQWDRLSQAEFDALLDYTDPSASACVYIRTRVNMGASMPEFATFLAVMHRPQSEPEGRIVHRRVEVEFTALQAA